MDTLFPSSLRSGPSRGPKAPRLPRSLFSHPSQTGGLPVPLDAPFKCPFCAQTFVRESGLASHLTRSHNRPPGDSPPPTTPSKEMSKLLDRVSNQLLCTLWSAYLEFRYDHDLDDQDVMILVNLRALADAYQWCPEVDRWTPSAPSTSSPHDDPTDTP